MIKGSLLACLLFLLQDCMGQGAFQLAPPQLIYTSSFFSGSTFFKVIFNQPGVSIHYTTNGNEPTDNDSLYSGPVQVVKRTVVKIKAFSKDFIPSESVSAIFVADGKAIRRIQYSMPNENYAKNNDNILHDNIGGIANYRSGTWLGYDNDSVILFIDLQKKETIHSILISLLQDENSWIFLPEQVQVFYYSEKENLFKPAGAKIFDHHEPGPKHCSIQEILPAHKIKTDRLKLVLLPLKKIPDWHAGRGKHGWLFIDEIKVY